MDMQIIYMPQMALSLLTANALPKTRFNIISIFVLHYFSWGVQFVGHGVFEKRAPALLDNILGGKVTST
jgi:2-hydroxy fatty acid dioxygenase